MSIKEVEAQALKLSLAERILLAKRLLASDRPEPFTDPNDPIFNFGKNPASGGSLEEASEHDHFIYDRSRL